MLRERPLVVIEELPVFVYGTLRTGQRNWSCLLQGRTVAEESAIAPDHIMFSEGIAFVGDGDGQVIGDLMTIDPECYQDVMEELDSLERVVGRDRGEGTLYCRVKRTVKVGQKEIEAWIYHGAPQILSRFQARPALRVVDGDWLAYNDTRYRAR